MGVTVVEVREANGPVVAAVARLLTQLSRSAAALDASGVARIVEHDATTLLVAEDERGEILGTLTLAVFPIPRLAPGPADQPASLCLTATDVVNWGGTPLPAWGPAYVGLGEVAYQRNELDLALRQVTEGIALSRQFVYTPPLAAGLVTLAWIGTGPAAPDPGLPGLIDPLTGREHQVLTMLAAGRPNQAIARELVVTLDTVKKHLGHVLGKLGAANRTEAVARAQQLGLIP